MSAKHVAERLSYPVQAAPRPQSARPSVCRTCPTRTDLGSNAKDLARSFRTVRANTIQVAEDIPEDKYGFRPAEGTRTVAETLAHLATRLRRCRTWRSG